MNHMLTVDDAACVLAISPATLRRWIREKTIPAIQVGSSYRIVERDLRTWLEERRVGGVSAAHSERASDG